MENEKNIVLNTDSYKQGHWLCYPEGTEYVYSYFEARSGAEFNNVQFFGLQAIIKKYLKGVVLTKEMIDNAEFICSKHFDNKVFDRAKWDYILEKYGGRLPIRIKAIPEGSIIPISNVLMTVENTDPNCAFLTNHLETLLSQIWYPSVVGTLSYATKTLIKKFLTNTCYEGSFFSGIDFMLHDFGFRGVSSVESAGMGGMAHLVNFKGTDTIVAMEYAMKYYNASLDGLAYSVPATEHSVMTALGEKGELDIIRKLIKTFPKGILSVVSDSYDIDRCVDEYYGKILKEDILARDGKFVVRPDSGDPVTGVIKILKSLYNNFGGVINIKGYKVLNPKVGILWGDGLDLDMICCILDEMEIQGWSAQNIVFGMGGGLLQKVNRDTQRFSFKSSAQCRNGVWYDVQKTPKDITKKSKGGRLKLIKSNGEYLTVREGSGSEPDILETVFENGNLLKDISFEEVRKNSNI